MIEKYHLRLKINLNFSFSIKYVISYHSNKNQMQQFLKINLKKVKKVKNALNKNVMSNNKLCVFIVSSFQPPQCGSSNKFVPPFFTQV